MPKKRSQFCFLNTVNLNPRKQREVVKDVGSKVQIVWDLECKFLSYWSLTGCYFTAFLNITES